MDRLTKSGIRPIFIQTEQGRLLSHLEAMSDTHIGLKLWSYINSLSTKLVRL